MEYVNVMIVDDDILAVDYMKNLIDWRELGYEIVAVAYNGKQALRQFQTYLPQIVITDINMPLMNGIELAREIKKINSNTRIILLTAYSEFEYARAALREGVDLYIIKDEINNKLITEKLSELRLVIESIARTSDILFQKAIIDYFMLGEDYVKQNYKSPNIDNVLKNQYQYLLIQQDLTLKLDNSDLNENENIKPIDILDSCMQNIKSKEALAKITQYVIIPDNRILLLLESEVEKKEYKSYQNIEYICKNLIEFLTERFNKKFSIFYEYRKMRMEDIKKYLEDPSLTRKYCFINGSGKIYNLLNCNLQKNTVKEEVDIKRIKSFFYDNSMEGFVTYISELFKICKENHGDYYKIIKIIYELLVDELPETFGFEKSRITLLPYHKIHDIEEAHVCLKDSFKHLCELKDFYEKQKYTPEVQKAITYINKNYKSKDLKIAQISEAVGMSSSRLSVVFKKDTNKTINQYITEIRIEKAKEFLEKGGYKIYEIADMVGYGNSQYLSQIFFKETGFYPNEYKKKVK